MRWLELCAVWCCEGWRTGSPRFSKLVGEACHIFADVIISPEQRQDFQRALLELLWERRNSARDLNSWLRDVEQELITELVSRSRTLNDESENLSALIERTAPGSAAAEMTLAQFSGCGEENDRVNLSTLHSAKGREFKVVIMFAMDNGRIPWRNVSPRQVLESRRLFYVGFTRAKMELHIMFTGGAPSPFVVEVQERLEQEL